MLQDIESYEQNQETMALLKMLALGARQIEEGKVQPADDVIRRLRSWAEGRKQTRTSTKSTNDLAPSMYSVFRIDWGQQPLVEG